MRLQRFPMALLVSAAVLVAAGPVPAAGAASSGVPGGVSVVPTKTDSFRSANGAHLEFGNQALGVTLHEKVDVLNTDTTAHTVDLYGADGTAAIGGGYSYSAQGAPMHGIGRWLTVAQSPLTLPPRTTTTVGITLSIPTAGVIGGTYVGAVVEEPVTAAPSGGGVATKTRFAMKVVVTVPGSPGTSPAPAPGGGGTTTPPAGVTVTHVDTHRHGRQVCPTVTYRNDGTTTTTPTVQASTHSGAGLGGSTGPAVTGPPVGPGATASVPIPCLNGPPFGPGTLRLTLTAPGQRPAALQVNASYWPFAIWISLLFLLLLLLWLVYEIRRRQLERRRELEELRRAAAAAGAVPAVIEPRTGPESTG